jgi:hypothetical protein
MRKKGALTLVAVPIDTARPGVKQSRERPASGLQQAYQTSVLRGLRALAVADDVEEGRVLGPLRGDAAKKFNGCASRQESSRSAREFVSSAAGLANPVHPRMSALVLVEQLETRLPRASVVVPVTRRNDAEATRMGPAPGSLAYLGKRTCPGTSSKTIARSVWNGS